MPKELAVNPIDRHVIRLPLRGLRNCATIRRQSIRSGGFGQGISPELCPLQSILADTCVDHLPLGIMQHDKRPLSAAGIEVGSRHKNRIAVIALPRVLCELPALIR